MVSTIFKGSGGSSVATPVRRMIFKSYLRNVMAYSKTASRENNYIMVD